MDSRNTYNLINTVVNPAWMNTQQKPIVEAAKICPTEVLALITRAMETGQDNLKKQAREENQGVADSKMKKALDDLMDACPGNFPPAGEDDNNADENKGE